MLLTIVDGVCEPIADGPTRILVARTVVALLPESLELVERLLANTKANPMIAELQFSLFVALEDVSAMSDGSTLVRRLAPVVEAYLLRVRRDTAQAAWMAGDLLGDHWPLDEPLPKLVGAAHEASYVAGRMGAIHGIAHALDRVGKRQQWELVDALQKIAVGDRSRFVCSYARLALGSMRGM